MKINLGAVPAIQDRQHREYLKRLQNALVQVGARVAEVDSKLTAKVSRIRADQIEADDQTETAAGAGTGTLVVDPFVLTADDIARKSVVLSKLPANRTKVQFSIFRGVDQRPDVDFTVEGTVVSWSGLSLELLLQAGDAITLRYNSA